jgi:hypothetical protein
LVAQRFAQHREQFLPQLQQMYAIPETEVEELRTAPETALPKLAAKLHYEIQLATFNSLVQALPELVSPIMEQRAQTQRYTEDFKSMWPDLHKSPDGRKAAEQAIRLTRQMNPQMSMEDVLKKAGALAMISLGLPVTAPAGTPVAPQAPAPQAPAMRPSPIGRPAGVTGAPANPVQHPGSSGDESNIFAEMAEAHLRGEN